MSLVVKIGFLVCLTILGWAMWRSYLEDRWK